MPRADILIRDYAAASDLDDLRAGFVALQDHERSIYGRLPRGTDVVENCLHHMFERCKACNGSTFIAESDGAFCGFVTVLVRVVSEDPDDGGLEYALVSDLFVAEAFRGLGVGRALLSAAEDHARENGAEWLRVGVIADNRPARALYESSGFEPWYVEQEKRLQASKD